MGNGGKWGGERRDGGANGGVYGRDGKFLSPAVSFKFTADDNELIPSPPPVIYIYTSCLWMGVSQPPPLPHLTNPKPKPKVFCSPPCGNKKQQWHFLGSFFCGERVLVGGFFWGGWWRWLWGLRGKNSNSFNGRLAISLRRAPSGKITRAHGGSLVIECKFIYK